MVKENLKQKKLSPSKEIAYIAVTCALLLGGQFVFSFVVGVEVVTLILVCFSFTFGARRGVICAVCFSLLRCVIYGFYPTVVILYLIYYPLLALIFGLIGKCENFSSPLCAAVVNILLVSIALACAVCYFTDVIRIAKAFAVTIKILLWVIFSICSVLCIIYDLIYFSSVSAKDEILKVVLVASVGAVMTALFTLMDDVITPLFWGYTPLTALAYFYSSFMAMLPQIICTVVTVSTLFLPLSAVFKKIYSL